MWITNGRSRGGWPAARWPQVAGLVRIQACRNGPGPAAGRVAGSGGVAGTEARFHTQSSISGGGSQEGFWYWMGGRWTVVGGQYPDEANPVSILLPFSPAPFLPCSPAAKSFRVACVACVAGVALERRQAGRFCVGPNCRFVFLSVVLAVSEVCEVSDVNTVSDHFNVFDISAACNGWEIIYSRGWNHIFFDLDRRGDIQSVGLGGSIFLMIIILLF